MKPKKLTSAGVFEPLCMLVALQIVLSRFLSIQTPITKIGFGFIPVMFAGVMYGSKGGALVGAVSDILGALLFPTGAYFPGYTLTAAFSGALYGFLLYDKHDIHRIVMVYAITTVVVTLCLNTFWIALQNGYLLVDSASRDFSRVAKMMRTLVYTRLPQAYVMFPVQVAVTYCMLEVAHVDKQIRALTQRGARAER